MDPNPQTEIVSSTTQESRKRAPGTQAVWHWRLSSSSVFMFISSSASLDAVVRRRVVESEKRVFDPVQFTASVNSSHSRQFTIIVTAPKAVNQGRENENGPEVNPESEAFRAVPIVPVRNHEIHDRRRNRREHRSRSKSRKRSVSRSSGGSSRAQKSWST